MPLDPARFYENGESVYNDDYQMPSSVYETAYWDSYYADRTDEAIEEIRKIKAILDREEN